jgi:hypothetical protein
MTRDNALSPKQLKANPALFEMATLADAAAKVKISERQLRRWLRESAFAAGVRTFGRELTVGAIGKLQRFSTQAALTLARLLNCGHAGAEARVALGILDQALRDVEVQDVIQRLEQVEAQLKKRADAPHPQPTGTGGRTYPAAAGPFPVSGSTPTMAERINRLLAVLQRAEHRRALALKGAGKPVPESLIPKLVMLSRAAVLTWFRALVDSSRRGDPCMPTLPTV